MSGGSIAVAKCVRIRDFCSATNIKSMLRGFIYVYDTPRNITVRPILLAIVCRLIQLFIILYGLYLLIYQRGYQEYSNSIVSTVQFKAKGTGYYPIEQNRSVFVDRDDLLISPSHSNTHFIMTNFIRTDQEYKRCTGPPSEIESTCRNHTDCQLKKNFLRTNGELTGRCIRANKSFISSGSQSKPGQCELEGWCPVVSDIVPPTPSRDSLNFTIFIKNMIQCPVFRIMKRNMVLDAEYLKRCNYDPVGNRICPVFRLGTILDIVESDPYQQKMILKTGGVILMNIDWYCNLDRSLDYCQPSYSFQRLDHYESGSFFAGFRESIVSYWKDGNNSFRTVIKAYGIQIVVSVSGRFGRFDIVTLVYSIVRTLVVLCSATFVFDSITLYMYRRPGANRDQSLHDLDSYVSGSEALPKHHNEDQIVQAR